MHLYRGHKSQEEERKVFQHVHFFLFCLHPPAVRICLHFLFSREERKGVDRLFFIIIEFIHYGCWLSSQRSTYAILGYTPFFLAPLPQQPRKIKFAEKSRMHPTPTKKRGGGRGFTVRSVSSKSCKTYDMIPTFYRTLHRIEHAHIYNESHTNTSLFCML